MDCAWTVQDVLALVSGLLGLGWPVLLGAALFAVLWRHGYPWGKRRGRLPP